MVRCPRTRRTGVARQLPGTDGVGRRRELAPAPPVQRNGVAVATGDRFQEAEAGWRWRPGVAAFLLGLAFSFGLTAWLGLLDRRTGPIGWYASVVWSLPLVLTAQGIAGGLYVRRLATRRNSDGEVGEVVSAESLIVVVPTIGRADTYVALTRVLISFSAYLPRYFPCVRIDVVVEEGCDIHGDLLRFQSSHPLVRIVTVPRDFRTARGTRFKSRANHYAHLLRQREGDARDDVWILHMDDDTSVNRYTAAEIARFVERQRLAGDERKHLAQGILAYPREFSRSRLTWYADAVRPGCDISLFSITTGRGRPRIGLHGELLLVRASVEARIGWDFGPRTIVEDTEFAMRFCDAYSGRSAWFPACSYGASPATLADFIRQRERWVWGLLTLLKQSSIPLRRRLLLLPTVALWVAAPMGNPVLLVVIGLLIGNADTTPATMLVGLLWAINFGFYMWLYWEGFKINTRCSADSRMRWGERAVVMVGTPVFAMMECLGILSGLARFLRGSEIRFTVIEKPV
jgi:egghead protein (zeste-white 4 protein)